MKAPFNSVSARQLVIEISDPSTVAQARRAVAKLASTAMFDEETAGKVALVVTEAATNIVKHAAPGVIAARILETAGRFGIEVLSIDKGPGLGNIAASLRDGHSTTGTPGGGLGALKRASSAFDLWSIPDRGAIVRMELWQGAPPPAETVPYGALCVEMKGEPICGDGWLVGQGRNSIIAFMVDGLGHGPDAAEAARVAVETIQANADSDATDLMDAVHHALRPTRGAAAAVALLQPQSELCTYCGIGNISASIRDGSGSRALVSHNGILGHNVRKMQDFSYPFRTGALLVMHSDGVATRWDLSAYPGLESRHPAMAAAAIHRDFSRGRDDAAVLVIRNGVSRP